MPGRNWDRVTDSDAVLSPHGAKYIRLFVAAAAGLAILCDNVADLVFYDFVMATGGGYTYTIAEHQV